MFKQLKSFLISKPKLPTRKALEKHDIILDDMEKTKIKARMTIEERVNRRGFPIGRLIRQGAKG